MTPCDDNVLNKRATAGEIVGMERGVLEDYAWRKTCECDYLRDQYALLVGRLEHILSIFDEIKSLTKFGKNPEK